MTKRLFLFSLVAITTSVIFAADPLTPPFTETFDDPDSYNRFTIINANNDDATFEITEGIARLRFSLAGPSDDWLVLPPLQLKGGCGYSVSFNSYGEYARYPEKFEVKAATLPTAKALASGVTIVSPTTIACTKEDPHHTEAIFTPDEDGTYYIGIHGCSAPDMFYLYIDDISVSSGISAGAPGAVTQASAERDSSGALRVTITYTAPSVDFSGSPLATLDGVNIYRDEELIATQHPAAGETISFMDENARQGEAIYSIIPFNTAGEGEPVRLTVFAGYNIPDTVQGLKVVYGEHNGQAMLTWQPVTTDVTGVTYPDGAVTYKVLRVYGYDQITIAEGLTVTHYRDDYCDPDAAQTGVYYSVVPVSEAGEGLPTNAPYICLGAPYQIPFAESFSDGEPAYGVWVTDGPGTWSIKGDYDSTLFASQDADNGLVLLYSDNTDEPSELITGCISLAGLPDAVLTFHTLAGEGNLNVTEVAIDCCDGEGFSSVAVFKGNSDADGSGWAAHSVDLTQWAGRDIRVAFRFSTVSHTLSGIDNILIIGRWEHNLSAESFSLPASIIAGVETGFPLTIRNIGTTQAENYNAVLYRDGEPVVTISGPQLRPGESTTVTFPQTASSLWNKGVTYSAVIDYPADGEPSDNSTSETEIAVRTLDLPIPGAITSSGTISSATFSWEAPVIPDALPVETTDDLSSLTPFSTGMTGNDLGGDDNIGDWSMIDGDGLPSIKVTGAPFPNNGIPMAFILFNGKAAGLDWEMFRDHGGDGNMFISFCAVNGRNDDWLISPRLSGAAQEISFHVKAIIADMPERYELFYSMSGKEKDDFLPIGSFRNAGADWEKVSASLPEGAVYFAVRYSSLDHYALLLDDFTFTPEPLTSGLELTGYNLYSGDRKINSDPLPLPVINGLQCGEDEEFRATALYNKGESSPTAPCLFSNTGITTPESDAVAVTVSAGSVNIISPAGGLITVTDISGRIRHRSISSGDDTISLPCGFYILTVGSSVRKITIP